jgi:hypothetical protein
MSRALSITDTSEAPARKQPFNPGWVIPVVVLLLSLLSSAYVAYSHNDKELAQRVTAVETRQEGTDKRLDRIEDKIDRILERMPAKRN